MKKLIKRSTSALIITAMLLLLGTSAFAADAKTVEVIGYRNDQEFLTEEEITSMSSHFSVSNVIDTFDVKEIDEYIDEGLIASPSSTITVLAKDNVVIFDVYKLTQTGDNTYEYHDEDRLPVSGQVKVYDIDETGAVDEDGYPLVVEKVIDASELENYDEEFPEYLPGCTVTLTEPGDYYVILRIEALSGAASAIVKVTGETSQQESTVETAETVEPKLPVTEPELPVNVSALPTNSKVLVNGAETSFDAYNIDGNNYFKLRDLATVVNGTEKQFEVEWDSAKNAINLVSDKPYTTAGGEMTEGDGKEKIGNLNTAKIYKNGEEIKLTAYNINNNNYFKLRDIAQAFNIGITWDNQTMTIGIDTTIGYTAD